MSVLSSKSTSPGLPQVNSPFCVLESSAHQPCLRVGSCEWLRPKALLTGF